MIGRVLRLVARTGGSVRVGGPQRGGGRQRGQALVEFSILLPVFMIVTTGLLEFGLVFNNHLTLEYATREGARTGAALADGKGDQATCDTIDAQIVAAVQRVLDAPGSPIDLSSVSNISIWRATASGQPDGSVGIFVWTYTGPNSGPSVDGKALSYSPPNPLPLTWQPCSRNAGGSTPDSIGVSLAYTYHMATPLAALLAMVGGPGATTLPMTDQTVMALNPN